MKSDHERLAEQYSFEDLASAMYIKGVWCGREKITDKSGWRELVVAEKLNHVAHSTISCGKYSEKFGSDAFDPESQKYSEYKTQSITDKDLRNLFRLPKKNGESYVSLRVKGVYNGAYSSESIDRYAEVDHYFAVFYQEKCLLIIKVDTDHVIKTLRGNNDKRKPGQTTNCNSVVVSLDDTSLYTVSYKNQEWFDANT